MNALAYALAYALAPRVEPPRLVVPEPPARGDDALGPRRCVSSMRSSAANGSVSGARRLADAEALRDSSSSIASFSSSSGVSSAVQPPCVRHSAKARSASIVSSASMANAPTCSGCSIEGGAFRRLSFSARAAARGRRACSMRAHAVSASAAPATETTGDISRDASTAERDASLAAARGRRARSISAAAVPANASGATASNAASTKTSLVTNRPRRFAALTRLDCSMRATSAPSHEGTGIARGARGASTKRRAATGRRSISIAYAAVSAEGVAWRGARMKPRAGLSPSLLAATGLRSASIWRTRKSRSRT
mmetsp:Transcript_7052/g.29088  ORF Transcript_7052/g.29088 Transcript_7052/m.29088 type:complete len:310 (+) Transcript_7052:1543-2472(+)